MSSDILLCGAGKPGSFRRTLTLSFGMGSIAFCLLSVPALLDRGHVADDVLHGWAIPISTGLTLLLLAIGLAVRGSWRRDGSDGPPPDRSWRVLGTMLAVALAITGFWIWRDYRLAADLSAHGVPAQARLVRSFNRSCGKAGCTVMLEYSFVPRGSGRPARGFARVGYGTRNADPAYDYAISTGTVPILYDSDHPSRSALYWSDRVARQGSARLALIELAVFAGIAAIALLPLALGTWVALRKRARVGANISSSPQ